jgi:CHAT domain
MKEAVIRIGQAVALGYPAELFERDGATLISLGPAEPVHLTDAELKEFEELLPETTPAAALQSSGEALYDKLRAALGKSLSDLLNGEPAQIYIEPAGELYRVPWEIMVWPKPSIVGFTPTWVSQAHHICRVFQPDWNAKLPDPQGPLRVLLAIGAPESDPTVMAEQEEEEIRRRLHPAQRTVDIESIRPQSRQALYDKIKDFLPHVLHFIGHGTSNPPKLKFAGWDWTAGEVAADVGRFNLNTWTPCVVFLNACRTGTAAGQAGPMAGAFLVNGAKAAIAMQGNILGKAAGTLAGVLYEKLGAGVAINEALSAARSEVAGEQGYKEAAYPALTMRLAPAVTLPSFQSMGADYRQRRQSCELLPKLDFFVNQVDPRRDLCRNFWPVRPVDIRQRFVLLRGDTGFGKTALSAWMLDLGLRMGYRVRYIKVSAEPGGVDYLKILKLIWGMNAPGHGSPLTDPLPPARADLLTLLEKSKDTAIYGVFRQALADASKEQPVTIVLDEFRRSMDRGSFWVLWENLIAPIARHELQNVNLLLVLGEDEYAEYGIDEELKSRPELRVPKKEIRLMVLEPQEFITRFREYLYFRSKKFHAEDLRTFIDMGVKLSTANDPRPLSVARFEEKTRDLATFLKLDIESLG